MKQANRKRSIVFGVFMLSMFIVGFAPTFVEAYPWFPSGDWWAIDGSDHYYGVYEGVPNQNSVKWVCDFYWDENKWPVDHYYQYSPPYGPTIYIDTWYFHELRRIQYGVGGDTDQNVMDALTTYYTTCPGPHEISIEEYSWWVPDWADSDEELEIVLKEPRLCTAGVLYTFRCYFLKNADYDDYRMQFESEWANHIESPPETWSLIEYCDYSPPSGLAQIGTSIQTLETIHYSFPDESHPNSDLESPVLSVIYSGGARPYLQTVVQGDYSTKVMVHEYARLDTIERLNSFISAKNDGIDSLERSVSSVDAIISFNRELSLDELMEIQNKYSLHIEWLRYLSTEGGGKIFVENESIIETIQCLEEEFQADFGSGFELAKGIGAIRATIPIESLDSFRAASFVLVIDCGPMEIAAEVSSSHKEATIRSIWYDIFQEYNLLSNS